MKKQAAAYWCVLFIAAFILSACGEDEISSDGDIDGDAELFTENDSETAENENGGDADAESDLEAEAETATESEIESETNQECQIWLSQQHEGLLHFSYTYEAERYGCDGTYFIVSDDYSWELQTCYPEFSFSAYINGKLSQIEAEDLLGEVFEASDGAQTVCDSTGPECSDAPVFYLYALSGSDELKLYYNCYENHPSWDFTAFIMEKMRALADADSGSATEAAACSGGCDASEVGLPACIGEKYLCSCKDGLKQFESCEVLCRQQDKISTGCAEIESEAAACGCVYGED